MQELVRITDNFAMSSAPRTVDRAAPAAVRPDVLEVAMQGGARVSRWLAWIGGAMLLLAAILVSLDVVFRAALKVTYFESFELSSYAFAIATAMGMSYALASRAHIRIEVLYTMLEPRTRGWLDAMAYTVLALCAVVLLYWCGQVVLGNYESGARSNSSLAVPLAIPQAIWLVGLGWFAVLAVLYALFGVVRCLRGHPEEAHRRIGAASLREEIKASVSREPRS